MTTQRKLLTKKQKNRICKRRLENYDAPCLKCPLCIELNTIQVNGKFCYTAMDKIKDEINKIDSEEVEVEL